MKACATERTERWSPVSTPATGVGVETDAHPLDTPGLRAKIQSCAALALFLVATAAASAEPATFAIRVQPILDQHCTVCHGAEKHKGGLRLDSHAAILTGGENGAVLVAGNAPGSDLFHRVTLPGTDEDVMPSDGKPLLSAAEIAVLEKWILAGAPETAEFDAPGPVPAFAAAPPAAPDYGPRLAEATKLAAKLGVRLLPRSRLATDGLVLRTASAPARCDDSTLAQLAAVADLIVEAELARTQVTDAGLAAVGTWKNLARLDLSRTAVTSAGIAQLAPLAKLETINLSQTKVTADGVATARTLPALKQVWAFGTPAEPAP